MPQLSRDNKQLDLKAARKSKAAKEAAEAEETEGKKGKTAGRPAGKVAPPSKAKSSHKLLSDEDEDDEEETSDEEDGDDDEIIAASERNKKNGGDQKIKFYIAGGAVVIILIALFLIFGKSRNNSTPTPPADEPGQTTQQDTPTPSEQEDVEPVTPDDPFVGTQDFRGDTTMTSDSQLSDPDDFIKDIYGLTLRVDYTVSKIQDASDFVNYEKKRGTWGGGLELYYLDAEYKGNHYVIQVPFKYYKELDDTGIVPVKMEVLRIKSETDGTYLSVISYMCLDEKTLESVLKTQSK